MAEYYTEEMKQLVERTVMKGSADKHVMQQLASIIWRIDQRLAALEEEVVVDDKPASKKTAKK